MSEWINTEFGFVPRNWTIQKIIDLQEKGILLVEDGNHGNNRPQLYEFVNEGVTFIKAGDIENQQVLFNSALKINNQAYLRIRKGKGENGDTLITHKGTVGRVAFVPTNNTQPFVCSPQTTFYRTLDESTLKKEFIYYYLLSPFFQSQFDSRSGESDMAPYVSLTSQRSLLFLIPPIKEQNQIVEILSSIQEKIHQLHHQNQTLEKMAETLFRQWFVEEENTDTISQLTYIQNGYAFKSKDFKEIGSNGVVKIKNISGGIIDIEKTDFIDNNVAQGVQYRFKIKTGDILIAMTGAEIGKLGIIPKTEKNLWLNQRVGLLKEKYKGSKYLAYLQLKSEFGQDYIENTATGSAQPNISGTGIENCGFPKLTETQIKEYSIQIGELYEKVIFNLGQIRTLSTLRDTLLPKLMSGEVRVV